MRILLNIEQAQVFSISHANNAIFGIVKEETPQLLVTAFM
jgi:hypothetical protein